MICFTPSRGHESATLLIAGAEQTQRSFLAAQLDADGHTVYEADNAAGVVAKLSCYAVDALLLAELQRPGEAARLVRALRAGEHERVHPGLAVITLGAGDELTALRAYEAGSDHHAPETTGYVLLRAVLASVARRALEDVSAQHLHVGAIDVDLASKTVTVAGTPVRVSRRGFELLVKFASDPQRAGFVSSRRGHGSARS